MKHDFQKSLPGQVVLGIFAIGFGLLFLLDNLDILNVRHVLSFWPTVFILFGLLKIYDTRTPGGLFLGGMLVLIGVIMTLNRLGFYYLGWHTLWPVVMILLGISVVARAMLNRRNIEQGADGLAPAPERDSDTVEATAILGGFKRRILSQQFKGGELTAIMGGCDIDLRNASIESEAVINVFAVCGGISLRIPPDWTLVMNGTPILGGFDEKTATPPNQSKRLVIQGYAIMGGVEVRN
ncbi:LiaI-LiaF-like domain-containing protein [Massilia sp. TS11]|uniref:LiaI-LiaF-like domain-containing protein n=1 Tax=Massilia sp. TS11 TaxID=2908003 RepID=UPI001ED9FEEC|nr:DUF5668 domain-containing protein [Massilia sp. TS11]MCG2584214.1 cell wall-active antibiotics response protein [Massilia sp. TS11]